MGMTNRRLLIFLFLLTVFSLSGCCSVSSLFCQPKWEFGMYVKQIGNEGINQLFGGGGYNEIDYKQACKIVCRTASSSDSIRLVMTDKGYIYDGGSNKGNPTILPIWECWCDTNGCGQDIS